MSGATCSARRVYSGGSQVASSLILRTVWEALESVPIRNEAHTVIVGIKQLNPSHLISEIQSGSEKGARARSSGSWWNRETYWIQYS